MRSSSSLSLLSQLFSHLSARRRLQFVALVGFTLCGALTEMITLGAIVPVLSLLAKPDLIHEYQFIQTVFNTLGWGASGNTLLYSCIVFAVLSLFAAVMRTAIAWAGFKFSFLVGLDIGAQVYGSTLRQSYLYHTQKSSSEILAGLNKIQQVVSVIYQSVICLIAITLGSAIFVALILIDASVALAVFAGFALLYLTISLGVRRHLKANGKITAVYERLRIQSMQEGLGAIRDVLVDAKQEFYLDRFKQYDRTFRNAQTLNGVLAVAPRYLIEGLGISVILGAAYWLSRDGEGFMAAIPILGAIALAAQRLLPQAQQVYMGWATIVSGRQAIIDVLDFINTDVEPVALDKSLRIDFKQQIQFADVSFKYGESLALDNISFVIPAGSKVGIIGRTGSGKSTLADVLLGLLPPTTGTIEIDGQLLTADLMTAWQAGIAHVPQSVYLVDASIVANIALGIPETLIDYQLVAKAAEGAQLNEFVNSLPEGFQTQVGERGVRLSGGQCQRIGLARALYKQASLIILDEATSALDNDTEELVMEAVRALSTDITVVIIAHRLTTLRDCDLIIELEAGQLVRQGTYAQLIGSSMAASNY